MKKMPRLLATLLGGTGFCLVLASSNPVLAQNYPVVHWINDAGQSADTVLNTNGVFVTDFKAQSDVTVTRLTSDSVEVTYDVFGGPTPGNNPAYLTNFVGVSNNGTGDGIAGDVVDLNMTSDVTGTLQFDFLHGLTPQDRILLVDVDGPEEYLLQAYVFNGSSNVQVSTEGWTGQDFSGTTGITPNSMWPNWNPNTGIVSSGTSENLDEELFVLTPNQTINRLVISKQNTGAANWSTDVTFLSLEAQPVITWANPVPVAYGTALSSNQLDATANVPGTFAYSPTNGAVLGPGSHTLSVLFTPSDTNDDTSASASVTLVVLPVGSSVPSLAVVHWINDEGQNGQTMLNTNGVFITDFKGSNDLTVTPLTPNSVTLNVDVFGGTTPGNNPAYLTSFVGMTNNGTGDGTNGDIEDLFMTSAATGSLQFDFSIPLTPQDRILLVDVDGPEEYLLQAYAFNGSSNVQLSLAGWTAQDFSGTTGITPNSTWPVWDPSTGILASGTSENLNEELFVLTPNQNVDRLVITKQNTGAENWETGVTFVSLSPLLLSIQKSGPNVVLTWNNPVFGLQTAPSLTGAYTNVSGATSPYTNPITGTQQFFRLQEQ
jgi:hypothetical protein